MRNAYDWHQAGGLPDRGHDAPEEAPWQSEPPAELIDPFPSARVYASGFAIPEWYDKVQERARLFAAAPELLSALTALTNVRGHLLSCPYGHHLGTSGCSEACEKTRAAIAKATGKEPR